MNELEKMVIKIEDKRFMSHFGIDPLAIARSFWINLKRGKYAQGASTITQQLARRLFLTNDKKLSRKLKEVYYAWLLERHMSKDQILKLYMDTAYMGNVAGKPIYGFEEAARAYFGKEINATNLAEKIALVAMLKGPNVYRPVSKRGVERQSFVRSKL